jgi:hypothetical protein
MLIECVTVRPDRLDITISKAGLSQLALQENLHTAQKIDNPPTIIHQPDIADGPDTVTLLIPIQIKRTHGRRLIVSQEGKDLVLPAHPKPDPVLVQAIGRSFGWKKLLEQSPELTIRDLAKQCGYSDRYLKKSPQKAGFWDKHQRTGNLLTDEWRRERDSNPR